MGNDNSNSGSNSDMHAVAAAMLGPRHTHVKYILYSKVEPVQFQLISHDQCDISKNHV